MKTVIIILFIIISNTLLGQTFGSPVKDTINYIDKNGLRQGKWIEQKDNYLRIGNYKNGKENGKFVVYEGKNKIREMEYKTGMLTGKWISYIGKNTDEEYTFVNDTMNGEAKAYLNGRLYKKGFYKNGKQHGMKYYYFKSGKKEMEILWDNGKEIFKKTYYKNGKIKFDKRNKSGIKYKKNGIPIYKYTETEQIYYDKKGNIKDRVKLKPNTTGYDTIIYTVYIDKKRTVKKTNRYRVMPFYNGEQCDTLKEFYKNGNLYLEKYHETEQKIIVNRYRKNGSLKNKTIDDLESMKRTSIDYSRNGKVKFKFSYNLRYFENLLKPKI